MAYGGSKKFVPRRGKARSVRAVKSRSMPRVDKLVEAAVGREMKKVRRGVPRSVVVKMSPCKVNRGIDPKDGQPEFCLLGGGEWTAYMNGPESEFKYAMFPLSELIPCQRPVQSGPNDSQRQLDSVTIKSVCVRLAVAHSDQVRLQLFAFRNGNRRDLPVDRTCRPFEIVSDENAVPCRLKYEVMDKYQLFGIVREDEQEATRHISWHDGPFATRLDGEDVGWKSYDGTSFTSRFSSQEAKPVGKITVSVDKGPKKSVGQTCKMNLSTGGLMRSIGTTNDSGIGAGLTALRYRELEFYIELNSRERFMEPSGSKSVNERPLELFLAFDGPRPFDVNKRESVPSGSITCMDMEVYYS